MSYDFSMPILPTTVPGTFANLGCSFLSGVFTYPTICDEEKELFKTADEINQIWIIEHAYKRQEFICQAQSVNLFFTLPSATEAQDVHDSYMQYVHDVHWYGLHKLKSLYYFRTNAARNVENVNTKIPRIRLDDVECIACEG